MPWLPAQGVHAKGIPSISTLAELIIALQHLQIAQWLNLREGGLEISQHNQLRSVPLLADCSEGVFARLSAATSISNFPPHVRLYHQSDEQRYLYVVLNGSVLLDFEHEGAVSTVMVARDGAVLGLSAVLSNSPAFMRATTLQRSRIAMIQAAVACEAIFSDPATAQSAARSLSLFNMRVLQKLHCRSLRSAVERLAGWLLRRAETPEGSMRMATLPVSKGQLAAKLGMSPESLSRSWATLRDAGVEVSGDSVRWSDDAVLRQIARPSPLLDREYA